MIQEERYEAILELLRERKHLTIEQTQDVLTVSPSTIRRDFHILVQRNLAKRSRGGISLLAGEKFGGNLPFELRQFSNEKEKEQLAVAAVSLIEPHQTIYIDGGTTTLQLARHLPKIPLTVITNSLPHVMTMIEHHRDNPDLEIYTAGGYVYTSWNVNLGPQARYCLSQYHGQYVFLSARGIDKQGVYNHNEMIVEIERTMIENADHVVFLMDDSKLGERSMSFLCDLGEIDYLVTNDNPEKKAFVKFLRDKGIHVIEVKK